MKKLSIFAIIILLSTTLATAQEQYGNIRGVIFDEEDNPLPGVSPKSVRSGSDRLKLQI